MAGGLEGFGDVVVQAAVGILLVAASLFFIQQEPLYCLLLLAAGADNLYDAYRRYAGVRPPWWYGAPNVFFSLLSIAASTAALLYAVRFATYYTFPGFLALAALFAADIGLAVREMVNPYTSTLKASEWLEG